MASLKAKDRLRIHKEFRIASTITYRFSEPPEGGLDLVTNRQDTILSASTETPGPDWKPGSGFIF